MKKLNKIAAVLLALTLALAMTACGAAKIDSVELPTELTVEKGETLDIELLVNAGDTDAAKVDEAINKLGGIVWETSNGDVIDIDENGQPVAVGKGEANLTGRLGDMTAVCKVTVLVTATGIEVPEKMELTIGDEAKNLDAKVLPEGAEVKLVYVSSDETVATVDENGNVTAVGVGECIVTTTSENSVVKDETQAEVAESDASAAESKPESADSTSTPDSEAVTTDTSAPAEEENEAPALKGETTIVVGEAEESETSDENEKAPSKTDDTDKDTGKDTGNKGSNTSNKDTSSKGDKNDNGSNSAANESTNGNGGNSTANQDNKPAPEVKPEKPVTPPAPQPTTPPAPPAPAPDPVPAPPLQPDENGVVNGNDGGVGHIDLEDGHWGTDTDAGNATPDDNIITW